MSFSTPVGFFIFNRPDLTQQVFTAIAQIKPKQLFIVADGPRSPDEAEKCEKTRSIIHQIDWDCELRTNFSDINLGCGRREASGLEWIFSQVEEAIFLEDDTLPDLSFFTFCQTLLDHYRDDERIMHINGDNSLSQKRNPYSYYFSKYMHSWGWASWRRAWQHYDYHMKTWTEFKSSKLMELVCDDVYEQQYWTAIFDQMHEDPQVIDTWDTQWMYACWSQGGLVIAPNGNLISNLGFNRVDASHTHGDNPRSKLATTSISEIYHPSFVVRDREADQTTFDYIFDGKTMKRTKLEKLLNKVRRRLGSAKQKVATWL